MNVLYRNDKLGYGSANTGYVFYFKQGSLINQQFTLGERISNRAVDIAVDGINNDDVWLFEVDNNNTLTEWSKVDSIYGVGASPVVDGQERTVFSVESGSNEKMATLFGNNVFNFFSPKLAIP